MTALLQCKCKSWVNIVKMFILLHFSDVIITFTVSTLFASSALMIELMISDKFIYLCVFQIMLMHDKLYWSDDLMLLLHSLLSAVIIHTYCVFIKYACKCKHCFKEKHDYVMNSVSRHLQILMHHVMQVMNYCLNINT